MLQSDLEDYIESLLERSETVDAIYENDRNNRGLIIDIDTDFTTFEAGYEAAGQRMTELHNLQEIYYSTEEVFPGGALTLCPILPNGNILNYGQLRDYALGLVQQRTVDEVYEADKIENGGYGILVDIITGPVEEFATSDAMVKWYNKFFDMQLKYYIIYDHVKLTGLDEIMDGLMNSDGPIVGISIRQEAIDDLYNRMDNIEADFINAMGNLLKDGSWSNQNYIPGQEQYLYNDALDVMKVMSRPTVSYQFGYMRLADELDVPFDDIGLNTLMRANDDELQVYDNVFVTKKTTGVDQKNLGSIEVSNKDITINTNDLGALLSRMSQLADLIEQKNALYDRAKAISKSGTFYADRLNGQIDVLKNQLLSTVSNWHTDESGNIVFEAADGGSAMMLTGAGFMIASEKEEDGSWRWRTFGTGN